MDRFTDELGVALVKTLQLLVTELVANAGGFDPRPAPGDPVRDRNRGLQIVEG